MTAADVGDSEGGGGGVTAYNGRFWETSPEWVSVPFQVGGI